ncbi:unnamed protein product [Chrysoparadoxa australica]
MEFGVFPSPAAAISSILFSVTDAALPDLNEGDEGNCRGGLLRPVIDAGQCEEEGFCMVKSRLPIPESEEGGNSLLDLCLAWDSQDFEVEYRAFDLFKAMRAGGLLLLVEPHQNRSGLLNSLEESPCFTLLQKTEIRAGAGRYIEELMLRGAAEGVLVAEELWRLEDGSFSGKPISLYVMTKNAEEDHAYMKLEESKVRLTSGFFDWRQEFPQLSVLKEHQDSLLAEAESIQQWQPWPESHYNEGGNEDWKVFPFVYTFPADDATKTTWIEATCKRCPKTAEVLRSIPGVRTALLSRLGSGTKISSHRGWAELANHVLRCHFGLIVPGHKDCGLWVEGEVCYHTQGDITVFDDSKLHKAFNVSEEDRIVLIVDMARPDTIPTGTARGDRTAELDGFIKAFS